MRLLVGLLTTAAVACGDAVQPVDGGPSFRPRIASFPGAQGWGAEALNECRSLPGEVRFVTTRDGSGPGSFKAAVESSRGDRYTFVIFRTGGNIEVMTTPTIDEPCIYIAGQTAPGDGVLFTNTQGANVSALVIRDSRVAIRYMRMRLRKGSRLSDGNFYVSVVRNSFAPSSHIIIDHVSGAWTFGSGYGFWRSDPESGAMEKITLQRSIAAEGLWNHSSGANVGGRASEEGWKLVFDVSFHHNFFTTNSSRNPRISAGYAPNSTTRGAEIINNVIYNWGSSISRHASSSVLDWRGNYYRKPLDRSVPGNELIRITHSDVQPAPSLYVEDNRCEPECANGSSQGALIRHDLSYDAVPESWFRSQPITPPPFPVTVQSARAAFDDVLGDVGANARLDCRGDWVAAIDAVDERLIDDARNWTTTIDGIPSEPVKPVPTLDPGTPCADDDGDGLPNEWESLHGVDDPWGDRDGDGYWNIEEYLNGTAP